MMSTDVPVLVYATFPDLDMAQAIAKELVTSKRAACVNILPGMRSVYRWEGAVETDEEVVAIVKTRRGLVGDVTHCIERMHAYDLPAIAAIPIEGGSKAFRDWIVAESPGPGGA